MSFSIIIPVYNEEESIGFVIDEIKQHHPDAEIIVVNDGSTDKTALMATKPNVKLISHSERKGQSHATWNGLQNASHELCILMDGDGECDPKDIEKLLKAAQSADFVCGYRVNRKRSFLNRSSSKIANAVRRFFTKDTARDTGAMKLIRKQHIEHLHLFDGMHRFIPSFLENVGLKHSQVLLAPRIRLGGVTKYNIGKRTLYGIRDIYYIRKILTTRND